MGTRIGFVMDPIEHIKIRKDSSFAMMLAAHRRGWEIHYMLQRDLFAEMDRARARTRVVTPVDDESGWFNTASEQTLDLTELDVILMRKDPPFDIEYITTTWLLEMAERAGTLVVNSPASLRDANEKLFITRFPQCCTPVLVSRDTQRVRDFVRQHEDVVLKPLDSMGGRSIFRVQPGDQNLSVILETMLGSGEHTIMAQKYIPEIREGDKRILLVNGEAVPYALARVPALGETRGNLVAGATGVGVELSERDRWICEQVSAALVDMGILFAGLDVIGEWLTEINITSPTCIRELDRQYGLDIAGQLLDCIESRLP